MVCDAVENTMKKEVPTQGPPPFETGDVVRVRGIPTAPLMSVSSCQLHSQHGWLVPVCWFVEDHEATSTFLAGQLEKVR